MLLCVVQVLDVVGNSVTKRRHGNPWWWTARSEKCRICAKGERKEGGEGRRRLARKVRREENVHRVTFHVIGRRARLGRAKSRGRPRVYPSRHVYAMCRAATAIFRATATVFDDIVTGAVYCVNCGTLKSPARRACIIRESRWKIVRPRSFSIECMQ